MELQGKQKPSSDQSDSTICDKYDLKKKAYVHVHLHTHTHTKSMTHNASDLRILVYTVKAGSQYDASACVALRHCVNL